MAEMGRSVDRYYEQQEADTALRHAVRDLFVAIDRRILVCDLPDSAFLTSLREALTASKMAHGEV